MKKNIKLCKKNGAVMIDLKFVDLPGSRPHFTMPIDQFIESILTEGIGFDGSSIRSFTDIKISDLVFCLIQKHSTLIMFAQKPVGSLFKIRKHRQRRILRHGN